MRKIIDEMRSRVEALLDGCDDLILAVRAGPAEYLALQRTIQGVEDAGSPHVFWLFNESFASGPAYADALCASFRTRLEAMNRGLAEDGEPPFPEMPADVTNAALDPAARLRALMIFARSLIADPERVRLVWCFLPHEIQDPGQWAALLAQVLAQQPPVPWCRQMRIVLRELRDPAPLHAHGQDLPRAQWYAPDLSAPALEKALEDEAMDAALPLAQRMQSLFVLAGFDVSQRRFEEASKKYTLLARYYHQAGDRPLCALSLNGMGEVADRAGQPKLAQQCFERALTPAISAQSLPALLQITLNLANLHRTQKRWLDAFEHYQSAMTLAKAISSTPLEIRCLEQMGFCRYQLRDTTGAWEHWNTGREKARKFGAGVELADCLTRLRALFAELGMGPRLREVEQELAELRARRKEAKA